MRLCVNQKDYLSTVTNGNLSVVNDPGSKVSIQVADGVKAIVMQHIYSNLELLHNRYNDGECIVSPVVKVYVKEMQEEQEHRNTSSQDHENIDNKVNHMYELTIPYYVDRKCGLLDSIKVKWGNIRGLLKELQKDKSVGKFEPYYKVYENHVTVYANRFCDVFCTYPQKVCASKVLAIPFGQIDLGYGRKETHAKVKTYLCSHLYQDVSLKKVRKIRFLLQFLFTIKCSTESCL